MTVKGKALGSFWTFRSLKDEGSGLHLPVEGPPGAWSVDGFRLLDLNTVIIGDLPARFDWSIIGWTILLLALMNLQTRREGRRGKGRLGSPSKHD